MSVYLVVATEQKNQSSCELPSMLWIVRAIFRMDIGLSQACITAPTKSLLQDPRPLALFISI